MSNLIDIQSQIEKLQKQANDIRTKEFDKTIQEIVSKMLAFGITLKDIQSASVRTAKSKGRTTANARVKVLPGKARKAGVPSSVPAKFRGPNGESWSGRGLTPKWLAALILAGKKKEEFAIQQ